MSSARLVTSDLYEFEEGDGRYARRTTCFGVSQGIALIIERLSH